VNLLNFIKRLMAVVGLLAIILGIYLLIARPYQLRWGASEQEINAQLPGDDIDPSPDFLATRAITIKGTPQEIWPWLIQMGYHRAGFYGYDLLENLGSQTGLLSAETILPEFQNFQVGDVVPISSVAEMKFYAIQPDQYLIWTDFDNTGSFLWALQPLDAEHTRLISRIRWSYHLDKPLGLPLELFTDFSDHLALREILAGVKVRVEGSDVPIVQQNTEFFLYLISALVFFTSLVLLLIRPLNWERWLAGLGAGLVWLITWYAPITLWLGILITVLSILGLIFVYRKRDKAYSPDP
jgi:hypothetical protein